MLYETETRWQHARRARFIGIGAAVGVVVFIGSFAVRIAIDPDPENASFSSWPIVLAVGVATAISIGLDRSLGQRRKFPYLDEYE